VTGYVYRPERADPLTPPIGFGVFRAFGEFGFELWLAAIASGWRGRGHGRTLLRGLLATPAGRLAFVARVKPESGGRGAMANLLGDLGYDVCRETPSTLWFVRADAPESVSARVFGAGATGGCGLEQDPERSVRLRTPSRAGVRR
jgi:hypothetical protein